jgi:hypothetical protein
VNVETPGTPQAAPKAFRAFFIRAFAPVVAFAVQVDELERVFERQVRQLARGVLSHPQRSALDSAAEADLSMTFRSHKRMFARA